jgi:hypothetical protein
MISVRSLRKSGVASSVRIAGKTYHFIGGQDAPVPESVADVLVMKRGESGQALFRCVSEEKQQTDSEIQSALGVQFEWKTAW